MNEEQQKIWNYLNQNELDQVVSSLENRANGVLDRSRALTRNWENRND